MECSAKLLDSAAAEGADATANAAEDAESLAAAEALGSNPHTCAEMRWVLGIELTQLRRRHMKAQAVLQGLGREPTLIELLDLVLVESPFREALVDAIAHHGPPKPRPDTELPEAVVMGVIGLLELAFMAQVMLCCSELTQYGCVTRSMLANLQFENGMAIAVGVAPDPAAVAAMMGTQG
jgi:hypothetical protein